MQSEGTYPTVATEDEIRAQERLGVLFIIKHLLERVPSRLGDHALRRTYGAVKDAIKDSIKECPLGSVTEYPRAPEKGSAIVERLVKDYAENYVCGLPVRAPGGDFKKAFAEQDALEARLDGGVDIGAQADAAVEREATR